MRCVTITATSIVTFRPHASKARPLHTIFMAKAGNPRAQTAEALSPARAARADTNVTSSAGEALPAAPKAVRDKLEKLGVRRQLDLVLHLPLRYEDETKLARLADAQSGDNVQLEC